MCEFDYVVKRDHVEKPIVAHKVFSRLTKNWAYFWAVVGKLPRGKWLRFDDNEVKNYGSQCHRFENGFHCFVRPARREKEMGLHADEPLETIPVQLKGDITVANQFGDEIVVGEWIYVPTVEELEREEALAQAA